MTHVDAWSKRREGSSRTVDKWYAASGFETTQDGPTGLVNFSRKALWLDDADVARHTRQVERPEIKETHLSRTLGLN